MGYESSIVLGSHAGGSGVVKLWDLGLGSEGNGGRGSWLTCAWAGIPDNLS